MKIVNGAIVIDGPVWTDKCRHKDGCYVASFECLGQQYDLYVWEHEPFGSSICIRFSNDDADYAGITSITELATGAQAGMEHYRDALGLLRRYGRITWQRKQPLEK